MIELSYDVPSGTFSLTEAVPPAPVPAMSFWGWAVLAWLITVSGWVLYAKRKGTAG